MIEKERVTVDFDSESYYLDGEFWVSWDHYGEDMADEINNLLNKQDERIQELEKENQELLLIIGNQKLRDELKKR